MAVRRTAPRKGFQQWLKTLFKPEAEGKAVREPPAEPAKEGPATARPVPAAGRDGAGDAPEPSRGAMASGPASTPASGAHPPSAEAPEPGQGRLEAVPEAAPRSRAHPRPGPRPREQIGGAPVGEATPAAAPSGEPATTSPAPPARPGAVRRAREALRLAERFGVEPVREPMHPQAEAPGEEPGTPAADVPSPPSASPDREPAVRAPAATGEASRSQLRRAPSPPAPRGVPWERLKRVTALPPRMANDSVANIAMLIDYDNMAIGVESAWKDERFDISKVIDTMRERGRIIIKRAYADWKRWGHWYQDTLSSTAVEMVHLPTHTGSNKNNADIRIAVDALEIVYQNPLIDTFIILTGDSDFIPMVSRLRENGKYVITVGVKERTSALLISNSDEFVSYDSMVGTVKQEDADSGFKFLVDVLSSTDDADIRLFAIKNHLLRKDPSFNEREYGFKQFKAFVMEAERRGFIELKDVESENPILVAKSERPRQGGGGHHRH